MYIETIISDDFRLYLMNYALANDKNINDLNLDYIYNKYVNYKSIKNNKINL